MIPGEKRSCIFLEATVEECKQVVGKQRDILAAVAEARHVNVDDVDAVEEIGPEVADFDFPLEVTARRANHPGLDPLFLMVANATELPVVEQLQHLGLHAWLSLLDFVQEKCTAIGY